MQELIEIANALKGDPTFMAVFTSYVGSVAWDSTKQSFSGISALLRGKADSIDLESLKADSSVGNLRASAQRFISEVLKAGDEQNKLIAPGDVQVIEAHVFEYLKGGQCDSNLRQSLEQLAGELNVPDVDGFLLAFSIALARTSTEIARLYLIELAESTDSKVDEVSRALETTTETVDDGFARTTESLDEVKSKLDSINAGVQNLTSPETKHLETINAVLAEKIEHLEEANRSLADEEAVRRLDEISTSFRLQNNVEVVQRSRELEEWLPAVDALQPSILCRCWLILAHTRLIESNHSSEEHLVLVKEAQEFRQRAEELVIQIESEDCANRCLLFDATMLAAQGKLSGASDLLASVDDDRCISTRLMLLHQQGQFDEACKAVSGISRSESWIDWAVACYVRSGNRDEADDALLWAEELQDTVTMQRCQTAYARAILHILTESGAVLSPVGMTTETRVEIESALAKVQPIAEAALLTQQAANGVEVDAVSMAATCCRQLGDLEKSRAYWNLIRDRSPIDFSFAECCYRGDVPIPDDLVARLQTDYPHWLEAQLLALAIQAESGLTGPELFEEVKKLVPLADGAADRARLARMAVQAATMSVSNHLIREIETFVATLVSADHELLKVLDATGLLQDGHPDKAERVVAEIEKPGPIPLQLLARVKAEQGAYAEAASILQRVGIEFGDSGLLHNAAILARKCRPVRLDLMISSMTALVALTPDDLKAQEHLAFLFIEAKQFNEAAKCFARLAKASEDPLTYLSNRANCLMRAGLTGPATEAFLELATASDDVRHHLAYAHLRAASGKPKDAFKYLKNLKEIYWDEGDFLNAYMFVAHASNEEEEAGFALQKLFELHEAEPDQNYLRMASLDEVRQMMNERSEQRTYLNEQIVFGMMPWTFCERLLDVVPYWAWHLRVQELRWRSETRADLASYSIFATHDCKPAEAGPPLLTRLECPQPGTKVVVDQTALITMFELGVLEDALDYFESIAIPSSYSQHIVDHLGRLLPQQASRIESVEMVLKAVEATQISVTDATGSSTPIVDEYAKDDSALLSIQDLVAILEAEGRLDQNRRELLPIYCKRDKSSTELMRGQQIQIELSTLRTISEIGLLHHVSELFDVSISEASRRHALAERSAYREKSDIKNKLEQLWSQLLGDKRVDASLILNHPSVDGDESNDESPGGLPFDEIDASLLAVQENLPLMADDRGCQGMVIARQGVAFSTNHVLEALHLHGRISDEVFAKAMLQLMDWRYKFLQVAPTQLNALCAQLSRVELERVARYVQTCCIDPGLPGPSKDATHYPVAFFFYRQWITCIGRCIADRWIDAACPEERAKEFTFWALKNLYPTCPLNLGPTRPQAVELMLWFFMEELARLLAETDDHNRAHEAMRFAGETLGLSRDQWIEFATRAMELVYSIETVPQSYKQGWCGHLAKHLLDDGQSENNSLRACVGFSQYGAFMQELPNPLPPEAVTAIKNGENRLDFGDGPLVGFKTSDGNGVVQLRDLFLNPDIEMRKAAKRGFEYFVSKQTPILSGKQRRKQVEAQLEGLVSNHPMVYSRAGVIIHDVFRHDFMYSLAVLKQAGGIYISDQIYYIADQMDDSLADLMRPKPDALSFLSDHPVVKARLSKSGFDELFDRITVGKDKIRGVLDNYYRVLGVVPFSPPYAASDFVARWLDGGSKRNATVEELVEWADSNGSPVARYHAAQIWLRLSTTFPDDSRMSELTTQVLSGSEFKTRCKLARHYLMHLSRLGNYGNAEILSIFSWWLSESLVNVVDSFPDNSRDAAYKTIHRIADEDEGIHKDVKPPLQPYSLRHATLNCDSIWSAALIGELASTERVANQELLKSAETQLVASYSCGPLAGRTERSPYAFDTDLSVSKCEDLAAFGKTAQRCDTVDGCTDLLRNQSNRDPKARVLASKLFRDSVYLSDEYRDEILDVVRSDSSIVDVLIGAEAEEKRLVIDALIELQQHQVDDWRTTLPHFFANIAIESNDDALRRDMFDAVVRSSISGDTVSALERMILADTTFKTMLQEWLAANESTPTHPLFRAKLCLIRSVNLR